MERRIAPNAIATLWAYTQQDSPNEACGVLIGDETGLYQQAYTLWNFAPDPTKEFWMLPRELAEFTDRFPHIMLWHSHPTSRWNLSGSDRQVMVTTQLPMVVVAVQPHPSVVLYAFEGRQIRMVQHYRVEGVTV